ncbi:CvpA family protein [Candidatus Ishikawella capsulata]|uniref:Membrane protein required for colicin V production n=1 Tax=Candidatus Ishikawaella capsulata Mpkobe TaxID=476281 RepID=C5WC54_9ENTR|nr:CvpA family protein [Candidatus Ishikawaella capsulata]BAH82910.1 membrane protein required for colicin V production [Candidatus Ishikawaella capsulata Mpkobe]
MTYIDYAIILIIFISSIISIIRGFVQESLNIITWFCAFFFSSKCYGYLSNWLTFIQDKIIRRLLAIVSIFIGVIILGNILKYIIYLLRPKIVQSTIDRILGGVFGIVRGIIMATILILLLEIFTSFSKNVLWQKSIFIPLFNHLMKLFFLNILNS